MILIKRFLFRNKKFQKPFYKYPFYWIGLLSFYFLNTTYYMKKNMKIKLSFYEHISEDFRDEYYSLLKKHHYQYKDQWKEEIILEIKMCKKFLKE